VVARQAMAQPGFATALAHRLAAVRSERVEVVGPRTHWATTVLVNDDITIARGWERQADEAQNPRFSGLAQLTVASYRGWLDAHAVASVALPVDADAADIDDGSAAEGALIRSGLPDLRPVWSDPRWVLHAVRDPARVSSPGATVVDLTDTGAVIGSQGPVTLSMRWSPWLVVTGGRVQRDGSQVRLVLTSAGPHQLHAAWRGPALVP
jgi:hypothetical protein